MIDCLFISPSGLAKTYQKLSEGVSAIEPPTWALMLAESLRFNNYSVDLVDANAEMLTDEQVNMKISELNPRIIVFVVYGQNVNAGTTSMTGAVSTANEIKRNNPDSKIIFIGSYMQALPRKCLEDEESIDIVCTNEGVKALLAILKLQEINSNNLKMVPGIVFREKEEIVFSKCPEIVQQNEMDSFLPGYAWDLLPKKEKFLDLYRSPYWHANYIENNRQPYAAIQTSLGCNFGCSFCMINTINRNDNQEVGIASDYKGMRFFSVENVIKEVKFLMKNGVRTIRFVDEMFLLHKKHFMPICEELVKLNQNDELRLWAYSRVDTVANYETLKLLRKAGFRWLALGIESGDRKVRLEVSKGKFKDVNIKQIIKMVHSADIEVMANYIFGLPGDSISSMQKTLDLSIDLNTSGWNAYTAMAIPGSKLYKDCIDNNIPLPPSYEAFSFYSYECLPTGTEKLSPRDVLLFRDNAFKIYHSNEEFQNRLKYKFGKQAVESVKKVLEIDLDRLLTQKQ